LGGGVIAAGYENGLCANIDLNMDLRRTLAKKELNFLSSLKAVDYLTTFSGRTIM
jgi:hypothetical protein